jgi:hypothetical protein
MVAAHVALFERVLSGELTPPRFDHLVEESAA